jgi:hypothetical protein
MKWTAIQCAVACVVGVLIYSAMTPHENPKAPLFGALIFGFGTAWAFGRICEHYGIKKRD